MRKLRRNKVDIIEIVFQSKSINIHISVKWLNYINCQSSSENYSLSGLSILQCYVNVYFFYEGAKAHEWKNPGSKSIHLFGCHRHAV